MSTAQPRSSAKRAPIKDDTVQMQHQHVPTGEGELWGGQDLKRALAAASVWVARNAEAINSLNVFPVPDGDTGTNMALTIQASVKQIDDLPSHSVSEIASQVSHGALMGARGNSGVILSQILRGFSDGVAGKERISALDFANGLVAATATAYRAVLKPVEGTILTVIKDTGLAAVEAAKKDNSFGYVLTQIAQAARASVARTPMLLDKLRDAGVVDAGGQGLWILLDGIRRYAEGEELESVEVDRVNGNAALEEAGHIVHVEHGEYGYCTNFLLVGSGWNFDQVRERIAALGDLAVIVGDDRIVKVHIHTEHPGTVLDYACTLGSLRQIGITNMQDQHDEFIEMHGAEEVGDKKPAEDTGAAQGRIAVLAVASGVGLAKTFKSMGASAIIEGGQTMNPSTEDILKAVEAVPQDEVIILPNNGNIIMSARQTESLTKKHVAVVPTDTVPQGISALLAMNYEASLEENVKAMQNAFKAVQTGEITRAVRDAKVNGIKVKTGQVIGLINGVLVTTGKETDGVAWDLFGKMNAKSSEIITIYWGGDIKEADAGSFRDRIQQRFSNAEVELVYGGQPFYEYIISVE